MTNDNPAHDLGDRLARLAGWTDQTQPEHHEQISAAIDATTKVIADALGMAGADLGQLDPKAVIL